MDEMYAYIDGESHYVRCEKACQAAFGSRARLEDLSYSRGAASRYATGSPLKLNHLAAANFFWDSGCFPLEFGFHALMPSRTVYFSSFTGTDDELHAANVFFRRNGVEPHLFKERKELEYRRQKMLEEYKVIEKPKGVDIALATRMLEDAYLNNYKVCSLFTSDVDYVPVIQAVRRMGKVVEVFGSRSGLGKGSLLEYVPDLFVDIGEEFMRKHYKLVSATPQDQKPVPVE